MPARIRHLEVLSETDLALINALQIAPRAAWSTIGQVIGVDPSTASRRWARLAEDRLAWFVVHPGAARLAPDTDAVVVRLRCRPGTATAVAERLALQRPVITVDLLAGTADVSAIVLGSGLADLHAHVDEITADDDVVTRQVVFVSQVFREDSQSRLGVLSAAQRSALDPARGDASAPDDGTVEALTAVLQEDVRTSFAELGRRLGTSEVTARRLLDRALGSHAIRLGCDVVGAAAGAGRSVLLDVEVDDPRRAGPAIATLTPVVRCAEVVAGSRLVLVARFATLTALAAFEESAARVAPGWVVRDRATVVRSVKRQGRLLDDVGRVRTASSSR